MGAGAGCHWRAGDATGAAHVMGRYRGGEPAAAVVHRVGGGDVDWRLN